MGLVTFCLKDKSDAPRNIQGERSNTGKSASERHRSMNMESFEAGDQCSKTEIACADTGDLENVGDLLIAISNRPLCMTEVLREEWEGLVGFVDSIIVSLPA